MKKKINTHSSCERHKEFSKSLHKKLVKEAFANSVSKVKDKKQFMEGKTITKSISEKKRTLKKTSTKKK